MILQLVKTLIVVAQATVFSQEPRRAYVRTIPEERIAAIQAAEEAYYRRELLNPVAEILSKESAENQAAWKDVLTTTEYMFPVIRGSAFEAYREHVGRGAETAYERGCRYPVPISYAYASQLKRGEVVSKAFEDLYENLKTDKRWNAASRLAFYGNALIVDKKKGYRPAAILEDCKRQQEQALYELLTDKNYSQDELGAVFHLARYYGRKSIGEVLDRLNAEGVELDPWLMTMLEAQLAYAKAWSARGDGFADTVTDEGWQTYHDELPKVLPLVEKAYRLRPELQQSAELAIEAAYGDHETGAWWLKRARAANPNGTRAVGLYLFNLRPRWCGSTRIMADYLLKIAEERKFDTMLPIFAYERIVKDVFYKEGGIRLAPREKPDVTKYVESKRAVFEPYLEAYRENRRDEKLPYIERVHLYLALTDLSWRLKRFDDFVYWWGLFDETKMPPYQTEFDFVTKEAHEYIRALRKVPASERLATLKRMMAMETMFSKPGVTDLMEFIVPSTRIPGQQDFKVELKNCASTHFKLRAKVKAKSDAGNTMINLNYMGAYVFCPKVADEALIEVEVDGESAKYSNNGEFVKEYKLDSTRYQYREIRGDFATHLTVEELTLEIY